MARSDGRYKCSIKGCRNYISNGTLCGKCLRPDSSTETAATPAPAPVVASEPISTLKALAAAAGVDVSTFPEVLHDPNPASLPTNPEESGAEAAPETREIFIPESGPIVSMPGPDPIQTETRPVPGITELTTLPTQPAPRKRAARVTPPTTASSSFDAAEAVRLYETGHKVVDIAVAMGYPRGHGQNRTVAALRKAGVYKAKA